MKKMFFRHGNKIAFWLVVSIYLISSTSIQFAKSIYKMSNEYAIMKESLEGLGGKELYDIARERERDDSSVIRWWQEHHGLWLYLKEPKGWKFDELIPPVYNSERSYVRSEMGWRLLQGKWGYHRGVDIVSKYDLRVKASHSGELRKGWDRYYGNYVVIQNGEFSTLYGHLSTIYIKSGPVKQGECIGIMGDSGNAYGIHLHYEVSFRGKVINPLSISTFNAKVEK